MNVDDKIYQAFNGSIQQVFISLVDNLTFQLTKKEIPYPTATGLMLAFYELGARDIIFSGSKSTSYEKLPDLINKAHKIGYLTISLDTNGAFDSSMLDREHFQKLTQITFTIDGYTAEMNDALQGEGTFEQAVVNIQYALAKGHNVHIKSRFHQKLATSQNGNNSGIVKMIDFVNELKVSVFHIQDAFKSGTPRDVLIQGIDTSLADYMQAFAEVSVFAGQEKNITLRMPIRVVTEEEYKQKIDYYSYCAVKNFDRVIINPNGMISICPLLYGSPYCIGYYDDKHIYWNNTPTNETLSLNMKTKTPCENQCKWRRRYFKQYVPLCVYP